MTCSGCGISVPPEARFCPNCGQAIAARSDERRVATILFADLVGFTTFSESADPESVKNLVDSCFERLVTDIAAFGGQVDKIVGDAIVALFGAPVAHEDDPERAVRAALRMQETLATMRRDHGFDAAMRVGINTGEVLVGALRVGGDYTAMGDVVNTASRLQVAASPGDVVVGPTTFAATRSAFRYEPLGPLAIKGREAPVDAWVAREAVTRPGQRGPRRKTRLVGRGIEMEVLGTTLRATVERHRAHLVLLSGEAGVGKTRLTRELGTEARERYDATVLHTHCAPFGEENPMSPIAEALRAVTGVDAASEITDARLFTRDAVRDATGLEENEPELERVTSGLLVLMDLERPAPDVDPSRAREDAVRALLTYFAALSDCSLLVLTVADLHWADDVVLELVDRLLTALHDRAFVLAATARPELDERWSPPPGRHNATVLNLEPLDAEAAAAMASAMLGDVPAELVTLLVERSGGNPFFIEELAAMITESDQPAAAADLPVTLRGLVTARLDTLDPGDRSTLDDCAVVGVSGPVELVAALATDPKAAPSSLVRLAERDLVELDEGTFTFRNELIREVAYGTLTKADRARRHAHITGVLAHPATDTSQIERVLGPLTNHYLQAVGLVAELGHVDGIAEDFGTRGRTFMLRAVERADDEENWSVLRRLSDLTLQLVPSSDPHHTDLLYRRARARAELRDTRGAREDLAIVESRAVAAGDDACLARVLVLLGDVFYKENDIDGARRTLDAAIDRWRELDDPDGLADALRQRAQVAMFGGDLAAAEHDALDALERFRAIGNRRGEAWGLQTLAFVSFFSGVSDITEARLNEAGALFAELGDWGGLGWSLGLLAWLRYTQGRFSEAERLAEQVRDDLGGADDDWALGMMQVLLANIALWRGQPAEAIHRAESARTIFEELDDAWGLLRALLPIARAQLCLGHLDAALAVAEQMGPVGKRLAGSPSGQIVSLLRSQLLVHAGDPVAGDAIHAIGLEADALFALGPEFATVDGLAALQRGDIDHALAALEVSDGNLRWHAPSPAAGIALALAYAAAGRTDDAIAQCDELEPLAVSYLDELQVGLARGLTLLQRGDTAEGMARLDATVARADATGSMLDWALTRLARASALESARIPEGSAARAEAEQMLARMHIPATGWSRLFTLAAGTPAPA
ncbi:MAG TPA: adenylate/guanylate cyclase domain-containing protein [Acidimicrobiia bacterium]|nr:adenylate/guanylate cyclase domain-containing protein [Acidimicrobiia bacterium]